MCVSLRFGCRCDIFFFSLPPSRSLSLSLTLALAHSTRGPPFSFSPFFSTDCALPIGPPRFLGTPIQLAWGLDFPFLAFFLTGSRPRKQSIDGPVFAAVSACMKRQHSSTLRWPWKLLTVHEDPAHQPLLRPSVQTVAHDGSVLSCFHGVTPMWLSAAEWMASLVSIPNHSLQSCRVEIV